jgi:hypothetical protein
LLVPKILAAYVPVAYNKWSKEVTLFFKEVDRLASTRGIEFTVKYVKSTRLAVTRYLSGEPLSVLEGVELRDGFPLWIIAFKPALLNRDELRLLMTLLVSLRGIQFKPVLDTSTIVAPWEGKDTIVESELRAACYALRITRRDVSFSFPHMSTKRGPLGQALLTSITEVTLLTPELVSDIMTLGGSKLASMLEALTDRLDILQWSSVAMLWAKEFKPKSKSLRKVSFFSDKEGKTRVIAILDYWTQTCLKPLHNTLNGMLRRIKTDCTFNQNRFLEVLPSTGPYYSLDLTAATDRMPLQVQKRVLSYVMSDEQVNSWARLLTSMEFTISGSTDTVRYTTGQPMGAYSSWPAMALTHHVLVRVAARRAGKTVFFDSYALLGDDIVIADSLVAEQYKLLLSELDMPISEAKTHVSNDTYEFAKRWVHKGEEVTGFSISGMFSVWKRYPLLHNFLVTQSHHGWSLELEKHPDLITTIYKVFRGPHFIYEACARVISLYMVFDSVSREINVGVYSESALAVLSKYFGVNASLSGESLMKFLKWSFTIAKRRLIKRDLEVFQKDLFYINDRLYKIAYGAIPACADQATRDFLKETIPVMVNWDNPLVLVLNRINDESFDLLLKLLAPEDDSSESLYREAGLSKYYIGRGVFSMKASTSKILADSAVNKYFITAARELDAQKWTIEQCESGQMPD